MAEVFSFRPHPVIRVEQFGGLWVVSIRPTPDDIQADRSFDNCEDAAAHATALKQTHGWRIRPDTLDRSLPGVA